MKTKTFSKKLLSVFITLTMLLALAMVFPVVSSADETSGDWSYTLNDDGTATITGYLGLSDTLTFPSVIKTVKVTKIGGSQFGNTSKIKSVVVPEGVKELGIALFSNYENLETVTLPSTLTTLGDSVFYKCPLLKTITIPANVSVIPVSAFAECTSLSSVSLGTNTKTISPNAFQGCKNLQSMVFSKNITSIGENAFRACTSLRVLDIPSNVRTIGQFAFQNCTSLQKANIPYGVKTIETSTFADCNALSSVTIPSTVVKICKEAFLNCHSLEKVYLPSSLKYIEAYCFGNCLSLKAAVFGGCYLRMPEVFTGSLNAQIFYPKTRAADWSQEAYGLNFTAYNEITSFTGTNLTLKSGKSGNLNVKYNPSSADFLDSILYISNDPAIASVTSDGTVTAKNSGITTISVSCPSGAAATFQVTVNPLAVKNLTASTKSTNSVELTWKETTEVSGYYIYRATSKSGSYKKIATVAYGTNSYTNTGLTKGKTYYYRVTSFTNLTSGSVSTKSSTVSAKACAPAPATVSATKTASGKATIKWSKSVGAAGYEIYYATSKTGTYKKLATITSGSTLSYKATGLTKGKTYYFKVRTYITVNGSKVYSAYSTIAKRKV